MPHADDYLQDFSDEEVEESNDTSLQETSDSDYEGSSDYDEVDLAEEIKLAEEDYVEEDTEEEEEETPDEDDREEEPTESEDFKNDENARNAERRRQQEQKMIEKARAASPEVALVQQLSAMYGKSPEELMQTLEQNILQTRSEREGVPVEYLKQMQELTLEVQQQRQEREMREFELWQSRITAEANTVKQSYPMLSDEDVAQAQEYMLTTLKNVDTPLETAIFALHGRKIVEAQHNAAENEALAKASGRKSKSVSPPKAGRSKQSEVLSAEEIRIAKEFGISEEDYLANRS